MFELTSHVRYSECDQTGHLSLLGAINYLQDTSVRHSVSVGRGPAAMAASGRAWLLAGWHIVVDELPELDEAITVTTVPYDDKSPILFRRFFELAREDGTPCVRADSIWFLFDAEAGRPVRVPEEEAAPYRGSEPQDTVEPAERRVRCTMELEAGEPLVVSEHLLDSNGHVNNAKYVQIALEAASAAAGRAWPVHDIRVGYANAAKLGDTIVPHVGIAGSEAQVELTDEGGTPWATVLFR